MSGVSCSPCRMASADVNWAITSLPSCRATVTVGGGAQFTVGTFSETVTYDTTSSPFTGVVSQQDAQERIAVAISQKIQTNLALYFHDGDQGRTPPAISVQKDNPTDRNPVMPKDATSQDSSSQDSTSPDSSGQDSSGQDSSGQ